MRGRDCPDLVQKRRSCPASHAKRRENGTLQAKAAGMLEQRMGQNSQATRGMRVWELPKWEGKMVRKKGKGMVNVW